MEPIKAIRYRSGNHGQTREAAAIAGEATSLKIFIKFEFLNVDENLRRF
jgi:hypothetical protein